MEQRHAIRDSARPESLRSATGQAQGLPSLALRPTIGAVRHTIVLAESLGLSLTIFCACGSTVITAQPGCEWCMEVQTPRGSVSNPAVLDVFITEPDTGTDPAGCLCFSAAEDQILESGAEAEQGGQPVPAGYEALRDELVEAARLRCTELALAEEPPLMHTNCLSVGTSLPHRGDGAGCTICVETGVWNGTQREVDCPPGLDDVTAGEPGTSTSGATTTGFASADETSASDSSGFGLRS